MKIPLGWLTTPSFADRQQPGQMYHGPNPSSGDEGKDSECSSKPSGETEPSRGWMAKANVTDRSSPYAGKPVCLRWHSIAGCSFIGCRFWQCCSKCNRTHRAFHCTQLPGSRGSKGPTFHTDSAIRQWVNRSNTSMHFASIGVHSNSTLSTKYSQATSIQGTSLRDSIAMVSQIVMW